MSSIVAVFLTVAPAAGFADSATRAKLELSDERLPLQELRPLDRRVYVLTLDGKWNEPPQSGVDYYINFLFDNGGSYSHMVDDDPLFRRGEVRCIIQTYRLKRNEFAEPGQFAIVVSAGKPVKGATSPEAVSNEFRVSWPMSDRQITAFRPRSRHAEPEPVDAFPIPGERQGAPVPAPPPARINKPGTTPPPSASPPADAAESRPPAPPKREQAPPPAKSVDQDEPPAKSAEPAPKPKPKGTPGKPPDSTPKAEPPPGR
jgi:hypothetical protein